MSQPNHSFAGLIITEHPAHPNNYSAGRGGHPIIAIVHHVMQGTQAGTDGWFANPAARVSAHYSIGKDGSIHRHVPDADTAYSNGYLRQPNVAAVPWLGDLLARHGNPNALTVAVEWEGAQVGTWGTVGPGLEGFLPGSITHWYTPPPAQWAAGAALTRALCRAYAIPIDRAHLTRHSDYDSVAKWWCPGLGLSIAKLIAAVQG